jgi:Uma2 family endonuclease
MPIATPILESAAQAAVQTVGQIADQTPDQTQAQSEIQPQRIELTEAPIMLFSGLTWREFRAVEQLLDRSGYRFSFLDGVLEIVKMPKELHETVKERLAALLALYLLAAGFEFTPTGSMTLESEADQVKCEADKSYRLKDHRGRSDLAIEVVVTSGGINKLEAYKRLKISELWFWDDSVLDLYHLRQDGETLSYEKINQSEAVPGIDLELLKRCILINSHVEALKVWQKAIGG